MTAGRSITSPAQRNGSRYRALQDTKTAFIRVAPTNDTPTPATDFVTIGPIGTSTPVVNPWSAYYAGLGQPVPVPTEDQTIVIPAAFLISNDISGSLIAADENKHISGNDALLKVVGATVNNRNATSPSIRRRETLRLFLQRMLWQCCDHLCDRRQRHRRESERR